MNLADRLYITHVHRKADADVYFPAIDQKMWKVIDNEEYRDINDTPPYTYTVYQRKGCTEIFGQTS
jgi:dihydrofolate reductase